MYTVGRVFPGTLHLNNVHLTPFELYLTVTYATLFLKNLENRILTKTFPFTNIFDFDFSKKTAHKESPGMPVGDLLKFCYIIYFST